MLPELNAKLPDLVPVKLIKEQLEQTLKQEKHLLRSNAFKIIQNLLIIASKIKAGYKTDKSKRAVTED